MFEQKYHILIAVCFLLFSTNGFAQKKITLPEQTGVIKNVIAVTAKPYPDHVRLRWNIADYRMFQQLCMNGVHIERIVVNRKNKAETNWQRLTQKPVKALPLDSFALPEYRTDSFCLMVAQCLYGKTILPQNVSLIEQIQNSQYDMANKQAIASLSAVMSQQAAFSAGLAFNDTVQVVEGKKYVYRLFIDSSYQDKIYDTGYVYVVTDFLHEPDRLSSVYALGGDHSIKLNWPLKGNFFSAYYVERSTDNIHFKRITDKPYLPYIDSSTVLLTYSDSVENYTTYYYRLIGLNSFGEEIVSHDVVFANAYDLTPPASPLLEVKNENNTLKLSWQQIREKDLRGFYILKGKNHASADTMLSNILLPPSATSFTYNIPTNFKSSYFWLMLVDTNGNYSTSNSVYAFLPDTTPPDPPVFIASEIDTSGIVTLRWKAAADDQLIGYKLFFANQEDHSFAPLTDIIDQDSFTYKIALTTLSPTIYYKLVSVDQNFNHSTFSKMLTITKPDLVPPPIPVIHDYLVSQNKLTLTWSAPGASDFSHYVIYKKLCKDSVWQELLKTTQSMIIDSLLHENEIYEYALCAYDIHGLKSSLSFPVTIKTGFFKRTENPEIKVKRINETEIEVSWNSSVNSVRQIVLYELVGKTYEQVAIINGDVSKYKLIAKGKKLPHFALRYRYINGGESNLLK